MDGVPGVIGTVTAITTLELEHRLELELAPTLPHFVSGYLALGIRLK